MPVTPIVLISLPRSGSTLVQRVLGSYEGVATASEPWLLLPLLLPLRGDVPAAGAWQPRIRQALADFWHTMPAGEAAYERGVGDAARSIYTEAARGAPFFLDKTPPYFLVIDEIVRVLPEARVVILWRNPLSVLASVVETFCDGRWRPYDYPTSLFGGLSRMVEGARRYPDRLHCVRYEDLLAGEGAWEGLTEFLGLPFDATALQRFPQLSLRGEMGDRTGVEAYRSVSTEPAEKWRRTIRNPVRRGWARRYLEWIGAERMATMGYDLDALRAELAADGGGLAGSARDAAEAVVSIGRDVVKARAARGSAPPSPWPAILAGAEGETR